VIWDPDAMAVLRDLRQRYDVAYGKIAQKLLGIAFLEAGATSVTERSVQGIDLQVVLDSQRLALEVKTTEKGIVQLAKKDVDGLRARASEGFEPHVAVLGFRTLDRWLLTRFHDAEFTPGRKLPVDALRAWRRPELEARVCPAFTAAVHRLGGEVLRVGPLALDDALRAYGAWHTA